MAQLVTQTNPQAKDQMNLNRNLKASVKITSALVLSLVFLAGCNGLQQDPLADQPENIRQGQAPGKVTKPIGKGTPKDDLFIDARDTLEFVEGQLGEATISGRVLADASGRVPVLGQDYDISIDNMSEFSGASYDAPSGTFKWTPFVGFVNANFTRNANIDVTLTTRGTTPMRITKTITAVVTRAKVDPSIVGVDDLVMAATKEGTTREFKVTVDDPHSEDVDNLRPRLIAVPVQAGLMSAANFIKCSGLSNCRPIRDPNNPKRWIFTMMLDLRNAEVTTGQETLSYGLMAVSRFGESSAVFSSRAKIFTSVQKPEISWAQNQQLDVVAGQENTLSFTVFDPRGEGDLMVNFINLASVVLGADAAWSCAPSAGNTSINLCKIRWKVSPTQSTGVYPVDLSFMNRNKYDSSDVLKGDIPTRYIRVVKAAMPVNGSL